MPVCLFDIGLRKARNTEEKDKLKRLIQGLKEQVKLDSFPIR